jgi:hypothetical protein
MFSPYVVYFFILILLVSNSRYRAGNAEVTVYTCREFRDKNMDQFFIPPALQMPYPFHILQQLSSVTHELFNFDLMPISPDSSGCPGGERKTVELQIRNNYKAGIKRDKLNSTLHLYSGTLYYFTWTGYLKAEKLYYQPKHYCISA